MAKNKRSSARLQRVAPQLIVDDVITTAEFYRNTLGFRFDNFFGNPPAFVIVYRDAVQINFRQTQPDKQGNSSNTHWVEDTYDIYIYVDSVEALAAELRAKNAEIVQEATRRYGMRELVVRDCNGYVICFGQDAERAA